MMDPRIKSEDDGKREGTRVTEKKESDREKRGHESDIKKKLYV